MNAIDFFEIDFHSSLFPLKTNLLLIKNHSAEIEQYIQKILSTDPAHIGYNFIPQTRVHAAKPRNHLRRTVVLDPVASYFIYDLIFRNRGSFGIDTSPTRTTFGYKFDGDHPLSVHKAYREFSASVELNRYLMYAHMMSFDIASYFNSIYHHDAVNWFASLPSISGADSNAFGRFFREINSGRSVDFLPQGIYPAKMIGSEFLRFIESSGQLKSAQTLRFMDDIYLFDNNIESLTQDFLRIQELLGLRALNINPTKTVVDGEKPSVQDAASAIQTELSEIIEDFDETKIFLPSGADMSDFDDGDEEDEEESDKEADLDEKQIERLLELLADPKAEESDVELILSILQQNSESLSTLIPSLLVRFPNIVKQLYNLAGMITKKDELTNELLSALEKSPYLIEYQLFWIAAMAEDHLSKTARYGELILKLYDKTSNHKVARAKILEIPDQSFGLKEIRDEILKTGASDWISWAPAMGTRTLNKAERNYALNYFSKGSPLNHLISECVKKL
ncbi:antiviral reverse transcriptase Drt5 [Pseudomonas syringae]|uniref:antiviral reverse transcriptase Drt5 n=1 Tax=Pseudomonas syringae TaxID=317 RepID=UPI000E328D60|nr:antiviral reverse transcriptase Drt5 [Pseudomonas syringae]